MIPSAFRTLLRTGVGASKRDLGLMRVVARGGLQVLTDDGDRRDPGLSDGRGSAGAAAIGGDGQDRLRQSAFARVDPGDIVT